MALCDSPRTGDKWVSDNNRMKRRELDRISYAYGGYITLRAPGFDLVYERRFARKPSSERDR